MFLTDIEPIRMNHKKKNLSRAWDVWESFLERIRDKNPLLAVLLSDVGLFNLTDENAVLASPSNSFARTQLRENSEIRNALAHLTTIHFGEGVRIDLIDAAPSLPDAPSLTLVLDQRRIRHRETMVAEAQHNPQICALLRICGGKIESVEPIGASILTPVGQRGLP